MASTAPTTTPPVAPVATSTPQAPAQPIMAAYQMTPQEASGGQAGIAAYYARVAALPPMGSTTPTAAPTSTPAVPMTPPAPTTPTVPPLASGDQSGTYTGPSIVDYLAHQGQPNDFASRAKLAEAHGIQGYQGTAEQNTQLLNSLRSGEATVPGVTSDTSGDQSTGTGTGSGDTQPPSTDDLFQSYLKELGYTPPDPNQSPMAVATDLMRQAHDQLGLTQLQSQIDALNKQYSDLQDKKTAEVNQVNENPWLSEGVKNGRLKQIDNAYKLDETNLTNKIKLYDSLNKQGEAQAQFIVTKALAAMDKSSAANDALVTKAFTLAQQQVRSSASLDLATQRQALAVAKQNAAPPKTINIKGYGVMQYDPKTGAYTPIQTTGGTGPGASTGTGAGSKPKPFAFTSKQLLTLQTMGLPNDAANNVLEGVKAGKSLESIRQDMRNAGLDFHLLDQVMHYVDPQHNAGIPGSSGSSSATGGASVPGL